MEALISMKEVAQRLGISPRGAWGLVRREELPHLRIGHRVLVRPEALAAWVRAREVGGPPTEV